ncbi:SEC14 domain and spectrin repeat-containing protein 1 [Petromyzon marinus]|uniref:SEC14 domain and spectrin repeat-containing protein 1 n=1 Tax=Petromyzon marinus TaxID=7757 RepID=A0AAJ7TQ27_PETMA|nr:SEC14 domain and spectrin repeat-containing protein 1 [Petromyzon marinus]
MGTPQKFVSNIEEAMLLEILKKKLAFLSGGKDRRSGLILTIPLNSDQNNIDEINVTLNYLLSIPSEKCKSRGFTVIVDGRKAAWNLVKTVVLTLQNVIPAEVSLVCVVKPDDFWDKKFTHFCFWKEKNRLGFEVILVSANKLTRYIEPCQLTEEFGGTLKHNHVDWVSKRMAFEKFERDSLTLLSEMARVMNGTKTSNQQSGNLPSDEHMLSGDPEAYAENGRQLLLDLQQSQGPRAEDDLVRFPVEGEVTVQARVLELLDAVHSQHEKCRELCRQQSQLIRLDDLRQKITEVVNWFEGPGADMLKEQRGIGDSARATQALQQKHEDIENLYTEWFAVYVDLGQQISALLSAAETAEGEEDEGGVGGSEGSSEELQALQQRLNDVCYRHAMQLEYRQSLLQAAADFHRLSHDLSHNLDGLLGVLCTDVLLVDGTTAQQSLRVLEEKLQTVEAVSQGLQEKSQALLELLGSPPPQATWRGEPGSGDGGEADTGTHVRALMDDMLLRKKRCEDMVDVRKLKLLQIIQVLKCEDDASQAVDWLGELQDAMLKTHTQLGDDSREVEALLEKHKKCHDVAQSTYEYGRELLQASVLMRKSLRYAGKASGEVLPRLTRAWKQFSATSDERGCRLAMAQAFHAAAEKVLREDASGTGNGSHDREREAEELGRSLLDRLTMPVSLPDGSEQFFGSPGDMAAATEGIREKLRLLEQRLSAPCGTPNGDF